MKIFSNNKTYTQIQFDKEADFEREVVNNSKLFFGSNSIYIDAKRKLTTKSLGNTIPDGFLFDLSDIQNPEFYIVEVELAKHDFYNHIFPQITKFIGHFKNPKNKSDLVEKLFSIISEDASLKNDLKHRIKEKEIYKFLKDTLERSQNVLLIIDADKKELPEIMDTYSDTWGKMVKKIQLTKFSCDAESIYAMNPEFENIEYVGIEIDDPKDVVELEYTEDYHLEGASEIIRETYYDLKKAILASGIGLIFNPQKHYISIRNDRNIAFFIIGRKKIRLVVKQSDEITRNEVFHHPVKTLAATVQKFWNGPSCAIIIEDRENLDEVKALLLKIGGVPVPTIHDLPSEYLESDITRDL